MSMWFETAGERGVLEVVCRDGSWFVAGPSTESAVKCLGTAFGTVTDDQPARRRIRGTVSSYRQGVGSRPNVLFLTDVMAAPDVETGRDPTTGDGMTAPCDETATGTVDGESPTASHHGESSLERIARERIGDREFSQADEESLVAGAQRRASDQHRDPAIDPRLQDERNGIGGDRRV